MLQCPVKALVRSDSTMFSGLMLNAHYMIFFFEAPIFPEAEHRSPPSPLRQPLV